jgi:hypothetical protein
VTREPCAGAAVVGKLMVTSPRATAVVVTAVTVPEELPDPPARLVLPFAQTATAAQQESPNQVDLFMRIYRCVRCDAMDGSR